MPENAEGGGGLMLAVVQLAIGLGSTVGGLIFDMSGYQSMFAASAALLLISAFLAFMASRTKHAVV
jgi:predicted MFS family arabinose efflux permease